MAVQPTLLRDTDMLVEILRSLLPSMADVFLELHTHKARLVTSMVSYLSRYLKGIMMLRLLIGHGLHPQLS